MPTPETEEDEEDSKADARACQWTSQASALSQFADFGGKTQSAGHIKPLHWYVACRLVIEGGIHPDDITPRSPFKIVKRKGTLRLEHDPSSGGRSEQTILGGLKTKNVDVVVSRKGLGPVLAVSCKGVTKALRNLTNRMEETIGECTNLHITYPALALGYLVVIRANRRVEAALDEAAPEQAEPAEALKANDMVLNDGGEPVALITRFHNAMRELTGRRGIRDDVSQYEAIALALVGMAGEDRGLLSASYPVEDSALRLERFFDTLYLRYDERFVFSAPDLASVTRRLAWSPDSSAFSGPNRLADLDYEPRLL